MKSKFRVYIQQVQKIKLHTKQYFKLFLEDSSKFLEVLFRNYLQGSKLLTKTSEAVKSLVQTNAHGTTRQCNNILKHKFLIFFILEKRTYTLNNTSNFHFWQEFNLKFATTCATDFYFYVKFKKLLRCLAKLTYGRNQIQKLLKLQ